MKLSQIFVPLGVVTVSVIAGLSVQQSGAVEDVAQTMQQPTITDQKLYNQGRAILDSYGAQDVQLNIVKEGAECAMSEAKSLKVVACADLGGSRIFINDDLLSTPASLQATLAHEYVHTLTSSEEAAWLKANVHVAGVRSTEVIADCGVSHFISTTSPDYQIDYMGGIGCTPELTAISEKVINDTLVK